VNRETHLLAGIELWLAFTFQSLLVSTVLYLSQKGYSLNDGIEILGVLGSCVYMTAITVGFIKVEETVVLKARLVSGLFFIALGYLALQSFYFLALSFIALGYGIAKPSVPILLKGGERTGLFQFYYIMTNLGSILAAGIFSLFDFCQCYLGIGFLTLGVTGIFSVFYFRPTQVSQFRLAFLGILGLCLYLCLHMSILFGLIPVMGLIAYQFYRQDALMALGAPQYLYLLMNALILFILFEQEFFLLQKYIEVQVDKPFSTPLFFSFNPIFVIFHSLILIPFYKKITVSLNQAIRWSFFSLGLGFIILMVFGVLPIARFSWIGAIFLIFCKSLAEALFIPQFIQRLAGGIQGNKAVGMSLFFLVIAVARYVASKIAIFSSFHEGFYALGLMAFFMFGVSFLRRKRI